MIVRKETRFSGRCPVTFVLDDAACQGTTFNLSRTGCAIESEEMASDGESVSLQIMVPGQPGRCAGRPGGSSELNFWLSWMNPKNG